MNLKRGFEKVTERLKTDDAIQILAMTGVGVFLFIILVAILSILEDRDVTFFTFFGGISIIALAIWGTFEVTEAGREE